MNDFERVMDMYPNLNYFEIPVDNLAYHGHIDGNDIYVNKYQPTHDKLLALIHEVMHVEMNHGEPLVILDTLNTYRESNVRKLAKKEFERLFGDIELYQYKTYFDLDM